MGRQALAVADRADRRVAADLVAGRRRRGAGRGRRRQRNRKLAAAGIALSALIVAIAVDIARSPIVPGANDNLSAVAALVALAELLRERPVPGLRVLLVSCGAEEVLQGGIYGFAERHFANLRKDRTWFLNLDTIGSPELIMAEGEDHSGWRTTPIPAFAT